MKPVQVEIKNKRVYAQVAFLVDSPLFLDLIHQLRTKFKLKNTLETDDYDQWQKHLHELSEMTTLDLVHAEIIDSSNLQVKEADQKRKYKLIADSFHKEIALIRETFQYPPHFDDLVMRAALFHRITDFKTVEVVMYQRTKESRPGTLNEMDSTTAILVTPFSTKEDVLQAFDEAKKLRNQIEKSNPLNTVLDKDTLSNIVRDRAWYWDRVNKKKHGKILEDWNKDTNNFPVQEENDVVKAVSRYKKALRHASKVTLS